MAGARFGIKRFNSDAPAGLAGRRAAHGDITGGRDERARNPEPLEYRERLIGGVALGNATQIEQHAGLEKLRGTLARIEPQQLVSYKFTRPLEAHGIRQFVLPTRPAPQPHLGTDGHVERPVRTPREPLTYFEHAIEVAAHLDRRPARTRRELHELARGLIIAHDI